MIDGASCLYQFQGGQPQNTVQDFYIRHVFVECGQMTLDGIDVATAQGTG